jgi:hypothetical protein
MGARPGRGAGLLHAEGRHGGPVRRDGAGARQLPLAHRRAGRAARHGDRAHGHSGAARDGRRDGRTGPGPDGEGICRHDLPHDRRLPGLLRGAHCARRGLRRDPGGASVRHRLVVPRPLRQPHPAHAGEGDGPRSEARRAEATMPRGARVYSRGLQAPIKTSSSCTGETGGVFRGSGGAGSARRPCNTTAR